MLIKDLQYWSPGHQIYYWFGEAYGFTSKTDENGRPLVIYLGTESEVKEALVNGRRSKRSIVNRIIDRERALSVKDKGVSVTNLLCLG